MKLVCELQSFNNFEKALDALILESKRNGICSEELYVALDVWIDLEIAEKMDEKFTLETDSTPVKHPKGESQ